MGRNIKVAKNLENSIEGRDNYKMKTYKHCGYFVYLIKLIFLGPFIIRERYMLINFSSKIVMFIAAFIQWFFQTIFLSQSMEFMDILFCVLCYRDKNSI